jgi:hypothetical protein
VTILLQNNLDVGPAGTFISVANSGANGDDPFDVVDIAGTAVAKYVDAVDMPGAAYVAEFATFSGASRSPSCGWTTSMGSQTHFWVRFYCRFNTNPPSGYDSPIFAVFNGSTLLTSVCVPGSSPDHYTVRDPVGEFGPSYYSFYPYTINLGEWVRIELEFSYSVPATLWTINGFLYTGDEIQSSISGAGSFTALGSVNSVEIGYPIAHTNYEPVQLSGFAISLDDWIGLAPRQHKGWPNIQPITLTSQSAAW